MSHGVLGACVSKFSLIYLVHLMAGLCLCHQWALWDQVTCSRAWSISVSEYQCIHTTILQNKSVSQHLPELGTASWHMLVWFSYFIPGSLLCLISGFRIKKQMSSKTLLDFWRCNKKQEENHMKGSSWCIALSLSRGSHLTSLSAG